jgi:hypothetical protein
MSYEPEVVAAIKRSIARKKATARPAKALELAGLVETGLQHSKYSQAGSGDRDSVGFLQQRPSQGWGPAGESADIDADQFLERAIALNNKGFKGSAGQLAAAIQRPAAQFRGRYDQHSKEAEQIFNGVLGSSQVPSLSNVSLNASSSGMIPGTSQDTSGKRDVFDVIRQFDAATNGGEPSSDSGLDDQLAQSNQMLMDAISRKNAPDTSSVGSSVTSIEPGGSGEGSIKITGPNPGRIKPEVIEFAKRVSAILGEPLVGSDGTGHSRLTVNGNVSQHTTGNATDIPATGQDLIRKGQAALIAAGMPREQAMKQTGGLFNVGGHQIIFNTHEGGDHTNHLHISALDERKKR